MRRRIRWLRPLLAGLVLLGLAACGGQAAPGTSEAAATPARTEDAVVAPTGAPTIALATATAAATALPATATEPVAAAPQATDAVTPSPEETEAAVGPASPYDSLPQSRTAEGYWVLGQPDAPTLIEHYSDFL